MMGAQNRSIAADGDYELENGSPVDVGLSKMPDVLLAIRTVKGSCKVAPDFGNAAAFIDKVIPSNATKIENAYTSAVQHLIDRGAIWKWSVSATASGSTFLVEIEFKDASGDQQTTETCKLIRRA